MFAFLPPGLAPWEIIALSAICAVSALSIATVIGVSVAYFATRAPRGSAQAAAAHAPPQPIGTTPPAAVMARAAG